MSPPLARALPTTWQRLVLDEKQSTQITRSVRRRAAKAPVDSTTSAEFAGLHYVQDTGASGIRRFGRGKHARYIDPRGRTVSNRKVLQRIASLAIPPAWTQVWICSHPLGHLQATGRDARGRKQYRYHQKWRVVRDEVKYGRLIAFAAALPRIRKQTRADLTRPGLPREKVLATVVQLLEKTLIRIGNEEYARENNSFGLTTMRDKHAVVDRANVHFVFRGKSGIAHRVDLHDARLARIVRSCRDLPGQELFQYVDADGHRQTIDSSDVNRYLRDICGEAFTAKDFRTWAGTVLAAQALTRSPACESKRAATRNINRAIEWVASQLGNTRTVCRKSYIHPAVLDAYLDGDTLTARTTRATGSRRPSSIALTPRELSVVAIIERRLDRARRAG